MNTAVCLNQNEAYIQGEPGTRNEASVYIKYEYRDEFWPEHWQKSYAECKNYLKTQHELFL